MSRTRYPMRPSRAAKIVHVRGAPANEDPARDTAARAETIAALLKLSTEIDFDLLDAEAGKLFRTLADIGAKIDSSAALGPVLALDLMTTGDVRGMITETLVGAIAMILNRGDSPAKVQTSDLNLGTGEIAALDLASNEKSEIFDSIDLPPHSARILRVKR